MHWFVPIIAGIAVGLAWLAIWAYSLHAFGIAVFPRKAEDRATRRERIRKMGKLRYILVFGMLGFGLAFGLGITTADFLQPDSFNWAYELPKLVFLSVVFGLFHGVRNWGEFRDPVPFPPNYPPNECRSCYIASLTMSAVSSTFRAHFSEHSEKSAISLSLMVLPFPTQARL